MEIVVKRGEVIQQKVSKKKKGRRKQGRGEPGFDPARLQYRRSRQRRTGKSQNSSEIRRRSEKIKHTREPVGDVGKNKTPRAHSLQRAINK